MNESGKLLKELIMHMNNFLIKSDNMIMPGDTLDGFVLPIEENRIYDILIETFDFKTKTILTKKYTVTDKPVDNKYILIYIRINDYNESITSDRYSGDCNILRLYADGTDPDIYRTIRIIDVTETDHSTCFVNGPEDIFNHSQTSDIDDRKQMICLFGKPLTSDADPTFATKDTDDQEKTDDMDERCDNEKLDTTPEITEEPDESEDYDLYDTVEDIENLLTDVDKFQSTLINLIERSSDIERDIEKHSENIIGSYITKNEIGLLHTYLSSIGMVYGDNLNRIMQNIKDSLGL